MTETPAPRPPALPKAIARPSGDQAGVEYRAEVSCCLPLPSAFTTYSPPSAWRPNSRGELTKASLGLAFAAGTLDRAVSAGEAVCDWAVRSKSVKTATATSATIAATAE
jgi:hypothetical protein